MGSGGVAIAALPTVICFKVPFSDGLGGGERLINHVTAKHEKLTKKNGYVTKKQESYQIEHIKIEIRLSYLYLRT